MTDHRSRARILDVREERKATSRFEFREDQATGEIILTGYAATFTPYDAFGGPERGGWVETLARNAFDQTLRSDPDVQLLLNHEGLPLARTKSGTMKLGVDQHGLLIRANLDPSDPDVQGLIPKMRRRDLDEMSFAFRVKDQVWDDNYTNRTITEVSLHKGDVSVVNYGMNPGTRAVLEQGVEALTSLSNEELVELRRLDPDLVHRATAAVSTLMDKRAWRADHNHDDLPPGESCPECAAQAEGQSATHFADPGHREKAPKPDARKTTDPFMAGVSHVDMVRNVDGGTTLVAVLFDGTRTPLPSSPASNLQQGSSPTPGDARLGGMFPVVWAPPGVRTADQRQEDDEEEKGDNPFADDEDDEEDPEDRAFGDDKAAPFKPGGGRDPDAPNDAHGKTREDDEVVPGEEKQRGDNPFADDEEDPEEEKKLSFGAGPINVTRALTEFRSKTGIPNVRNIDEGLAYLRRA
jgi:HK97 family phage prohead protease